MLGSALVLGALVGTVSASAATEGVQDDFDRVVSQGWGKATSGQVYSTGSASLSVKDGAGRVALAPGTDAAAVSESVSLADTYSKTIVSVAPTSAGSSVGVSASLLVRRKSLGYFYEARVRQMSGGRFGLTLLRSDRKSVTSLAGETVVVSGAAADQRISVEVVATGSSPVTLKARAWVTGQSVLPGWQVTASDSSSARLESGSTGLKFNSPSGAAATLVSAHQYRASDVGDVSTNSGSVRQLTDDFARNWSEGWGASSSGTLYATGAPGRLSVDGSRGKARVEPGKSAAAVAEGLTLRDVTAKIDLAVGATPQGAGTHSAVILRRATIGKYYQARLHHLANSTVALAIERVDGVTVTPIVAENTVGTSVSSGATYTVEFSVTGTSPVTVRARAWRSGATAPAWQLSGSDSSDRRLVAGGAPGVKFDVAADAATATILADNFTTAEAGDVPATTPTTVPTTAPTTAPTSSPTTAPAPEPTVAPTTPTASEPGSLPVGKAAYPVPGDAIYVAPLGTTAGAGTKSNPYGSVATALSKAKSGSTLVLRGGSYHENVLVDTYKTGIVIQNYPGEAVWFDGAKRVSNWTASGSRWVSTGWTDVFDHRIMSGSTDETNRYVDAARPMASYPDQVWIDGRQLTQVASESAVTAGKFFIDTSGKRIVIGDNPAGKTVAASALKRAMEIHAQNAVLRGFGVRRYATTSGQFAAVIAGVPGITMENMTVSDNSWLGIAAWAAGQKYRHVTVSGNAIMGLGGNKVDGLVIEDSVFRGNNAEGFKPAPVASGVKITRAKGVVMRNNVIADTPYAGGLWFDVSSSDLTIVGNTIANNTAGLMIELSEGAVVADNHFEGNEGSGVRIQASGSVDVWNNTFDGNGRPLAVWADGRRQDVASLVATIPWIVDDIDVHNNVMAFSGANNCPILTQDEAQVLVGNQFGITSNNNVFQRPSASNPSNFACWANGVKQIVSFKNLQQFRDGTGNDLKSTLTEGTPVLAGNGTLTAATKASVPTVAAALPSSVASKIGQTSGTKWLGAFSARHD